MALTIPIAHDFICPWCWVGLLQARRLQKEFGIEVDWLGYELIPDELEWPDFTPAPEVPNRPHTLSRFEFLLACEDMEMPKVDKPRRMRSHNAHEAVEYAKADGNHDALVETLYRAYWERGEDINNPEVLRKLAASHVRDSDSMVTAIQERRFKDHIVGFDNDAHRQGIWNVPTFYIGGERLAEQPYRALERAMKGAVSQVG